MKKKKTSIDFLLLLAFWLIASTSFGQDKYIVNLGNANIKELVNQEGGTINIEKVAKIEIHFTPTTQLNGYETKIFNLLESIADRGDIELDYGGLRNEDLREYESSLKRLMDKYEERLQSIKNLTEETIDRFDKDIIAKSRRLDGLIARCELILENRDYLFKYTPRKVTKDGKTVYGFRMRDLARDPNIGFAGASKDDKISVVENNTFGYRDRNGTFIPEKTYEPSYEEPKYEEQYDEPKYRYGLQLETFRSWVFTKDQSIERNATQQGLGIGLNAEMTLVESWIKGTVAAKMSFNRGGSVLHQYGGELWPSLNEKADGSIVINLNQDEIIFSDSVSLSYQLRYLEIPLGLKIFPTGKFFGLYCQPYFSININAKATGTANDEDFPIQKEKIKKEVRSTSFAYGFGIGYDKRLSNGSKISLGVFYEQDLTNFYANNGKRHIRDSGFFTIVPENSKLFSKSLNLRITFLI